MNEQSDNRHPVLTAFSRAAKGALIGIANAVPGLSGGTIAVVTGLYDELVEGLAHILKNIPLLLSVGTGVGLGLLGFANLVDFLLARYSEPTVIFFMGLVAGSFPSLLKHSGIRKFRISYALLFAAALGAVVVMGLEFSLAAAEPITVLQAGNVPLLFAGGVVGAAAMIIPGISGSFILLMMGLYSTFIRAIKDFNIPVLFVVGLGVLVGLFSLAKLMNWLLKRFPLGTYAAILGLVAGSLVTLWPGAPLQTPLLSAGTFLLGFAAAFAMGRFGGLSSSVPPG